MRLSPIHHVAIIVSDYEAALSFYRDALGLRVLRDVFRPERGDRKLDLDLGDGTQLELFVKPESPARPSYPEALGLRHLAFAVESVAAAVDELARRGIVCEPVRLDPYTGKNATFFADPDGLPLELYET